MAIDDTDEPSGVTTEDTLIGAHTEDTNMAYGRNRFTRSSSRRNITKATGGMRANPAGAMELIRHSVINTAGTGNNTLADGKARAYPLCVYYGISGNSTSTPNESSSASIANLSRVDNIEIELTITQSDTSKPNDVYIGFITTSFNDAMWLNTDALAENYASLISPFDYTSSTGLMNLYSGTKDLTINQWRQSSTLRHFIRGFSKNTRTLCSGRPIIMNQVVPLPAKCKRGQQGMGFWIVIMNDSYNGQGETASGDGTNINIQMSSSFKEIPNITPPISA